MFRIKNVNAVLFELHSGVEKQSGWGRSVAESFSNIIPAGCHVLIDNYFTSIRLLRTLAEKLIGYTCTVRNEQHVLIDEFFLEKQSWYL